MDKILGGLVLINGVDIWTEYGAFLTEEKKGGRENQTAILKPSKVKKYTAVDIREENGKKYSQKLDVANDEREVVLHFALFADTKAEWLERYRAFIAFLKQGNDGWLEFHFTELGLTLRMFYADCSKFEPLTYLWKEGKQASRFKVKFTEPDPII